VLNYFPKYFTSKAIYLYLGVLVLCNIIFLSHPLALVWWGFGIVEVLSFFYFSNQLTRTWADYSEKRFLKNIFVTAFLIRLGWVVFSYFFYIYMTGRPFEFDAADASGYHTEASWVADMIHNSNIQPYFDYIKGRYSDMGYPFYLGIEYSITGNSIIIERILKSIFGAYTCVLIYKLGKRTFSEEVGRMSAIFCMLMPNMILYSGLHVKEVEMVFLTVWFLERSDAMFRNKNFNFAEIAPPVLIAGSLFFFRTVLGITSILALFTTIVFTTSKILGFGKRMILVVWILAVVGYFVGGTISTEIESVWATRGNSQEQSMKMRATEINGNKFAKYAKGAVFAPVIFVIPFPTIIETPLQQNQKIINGGNYVKNIMAFFTIFALYWIIKNKKWRDYMLLGSFTIGYLIIIALSAFAQSERFHQPVVPFELLFAAFGISIMTNKDKKYFRWWMIFIFIAIVGWSWVKLAGRDLT